MLNKNEARVSVYYFGDTGIHAVADSNADLESIMRKMMELALRFTEANIFDLTYEVKNLMRKESLEPRVIRFRENGISSTVLHCDTTDNMYCDTRPLAPGIQDWALYIDQQTGEIVFVRVLLR